MPSRTLPQEFSPISLGPLEDLLAKINSSIFLDSCKDGQFRRYQGARTKKDFINFVSDQEWRSIEPVSSWFGPSSFL